MPFDLAMNEGENAHVRDFLIGGIEAEGRSGRETLDGLARQVVAEEDGTRVHVLCYKGLAKSRRVLVGVYEVRFYGWKTADSNEVLQ